MPRNEPGRRSKPFNMVTTAEGSAYVQRLADMERDGERTMFALGPYTLFLIVTCLQAALRRTGMAPILAVTLRVIVERLAEPFNGTLGADAINAVAADGYGLITPAVAEQAFQHWMVTAYPDGSGYAKDMFADTDMFAAFAAGMAYQQTVRRTGNGPG